jgi:hypothetical protein
VCSPAWDAAQVLLDQLLDVSYPIAQLAAVKRKHDILQTATTHNAV